MKLLTKDEINKASQQQKQMLIEKNSQLLSSLQKKIRLSNEIPYDFERAKREKDYKNFVTDLNKKKSEQLKELKAYQDKTEEAKEILFTVLERTDKLKDEQISLEEEISRLKLQTKWLKINLDKQNVELYSEA